MASPALVSMKTRWPRVVSSRTAAGIMPTRNSLFLISFGTPIFIASVQSLQHRADAVDQAADFAFACNQSRDQDDRIAGDADDEIFVEESHLQRLIAAL